MTMKPLLLALLLGFAAPVDIAQHIIDSGPYEQGFEDGYHDGWCSSSVAPDFCLSPPAPMAPFPPVGRDSYSGGYGIGFLQGVDDEHEQNPEP